MKYAHENGCPWDKYTCTRAAETGHLDCLKYAHENGCPWDKGTCTMAAQSGHLECLKYAHDNGCPWGKGTCTMAAQSGHLECLKYARENGCPWNQKACEYAAKSKNLECLEYVVHHVREHGRPNPSLANRLKKQAPPPPPDVGNALALEMALSYNRHDFVSLREILPFWREHRNERDVHLKTVQTVVLRYFAERR